MQADVDTEFAAPADTSGLEEYVRSVFSDIKLMLDYARASGKPLAADLPSRVAELQAGSPLASLVRVHNDLCEVIKPATPATLRATQPSSGVPSVPMFNVMLRLSIFALVLHLASTAWLRTEKTRRAAAPATGASAQHHLASTTEAAPSEHRP